MSDPAPAERKRVWSTPPNVPLCPETELADPGARSFVLQIGEAFFHGFVVRKAGGPNSLIRYASEKAISNNIAAQGGDPALLNL